MDPETGIIRIVVEVPRDLHRKFKAQVYTDEKTIKGTILEIIEMYVEDNNSKENKK